MKTGIIERLKQATTGAEVRALLAEAAKFKSADPKTQRRWARLAREKGVEV